MKDLTKCIDCKNAYDAHGAPVIIKCNITNKNYVANALRKCNYFRIGGAIWRQKVL